jgi:hypothetical protein
MTGAALLFGTACTPDDYDLASPDISADDLVEGIAFTIEHDTNNPNIVYLHSLLDSKYTIAWETPQGRYVSSDATLKMPFSGDYQVKMAVSTRGGYVWSNPATFSIADFCDEFVSHYLWKRVSGGVGQSKTWQLDLGLLEDGSTKTTFFGAPHWYFNGNYTWDHLHAATEDEETNDNFLDNDDWEKSMAINPDEVPVDNDNDEANWYWPATYSGNEWMCDLKNYGYMTLDLINGANVTITDAAGNVVGKGTYMLDPDEHTITFSDVYPLNTDSSTNRTFKLIYLSDNGMCIIPIYDGCCTSLNYITKDYFEGYQPEVNKSLPDGWFQSFNNQNLYGSWKLDETVPFDWFTLDGERTNKYTNFSSSISSDVANVTFKVNSPELGLYTAKDINENEYSGNFTVSSDGTLTFDGGLGTSTIADGITHSAGSNNTLKVLDVTFDDLGRISDIWLGKAETDYKGNEIEYLGYHYVAVLGGSDKTTYKTILQCFDTGWAFYDSETLYIDSEGTYTLTSYVDGFDAYGIFLDSYKLLGDHPNCDIKITDIKVDGTSIAFDDSEISRGAGDLTTTARRYILNPWNEVSAATTPLYTGAKSSISVTIQVSFDTGSAFVPATDAAGVKQFRKQVSKRIRR